MTNSALGRTIILAVLLTLSLCYARPAAALSCWKVTDWVTLPSFVPRAVLVNHDCTTTPSGYGWTDVHYAYDGSEPSGLWLLINYSDPHTSGDYLFLDGYDSAGAPLVNWDPVVGGGGSPMPLTDTPPGASIPTAGLSLWLRSDMGITVSGDRVVTWQDQSSAGRYANGGATTTLPRILYGALNGKPVLRFEGAQKLFTQPSSLSISRWTIFVVGKNNNPTESFGLILGPGDGVNNNQLRYENGSQILTYGYSNNMPIIYSTVGNTRVYHSFAVRYDGWTYQVFRDGVLKNTRNFSTTQPWILGLIGAWFSSCSSCYLRGDLAEIIVYDRALPDSERMSVEQYLRAKYALP